MRNFLLFIFLSLFTSQTLAMSDYNKARNVLMSKIFSQLEGAQTLYCSCPIVFENDRRYYPNLKKCGYEVRSPAFKGKASRISIEHIVPAWEFGKQFSCWKQGGRKKCSADDSFFKEMEGDLHNLYPSLAEVNKDRSNFRFSEWNAKPSTYGKCATVIDFKHKQVQPQIAARGIIARAYLYMQDRYKLKLAVQQQKLFEAWDKQYPPTALECERNLLILKVQGNQNPFVSRKCKGQENLFDLESESNSMSNMLFDVIDGLGI